MTGEFEPFRIDVEPERESVRVAPFGELDIVHSLQRYPFGRWLLGAGSAPDPILRPIDPNPACWRGFARPHAGS